MATGVRPIRIEVPRTGQAFTFTKVLNAGQEPLTASFSMMRLKVYRGGADGRAGLRLRARPDHALVAVAAPERSSLWMTIALVLILWSVPACSPCGACSMSASSPPCRCLLFVFVALGGAGNTSTAAKRDRRPASPRRLHPFRPPAAAPPPPQPPPCSCFLAFGASCLLRARR